jgi:hypothetical protein
VRATIPCSDLVVLVRPQLAARGDVDETHAHPLAASDFADGPAQREVCAATRGPVRVSAPAAEDDVHVLVAAQLGRELLSKQGTRPRLLRGAFEGVDHDDGPVVPVGPRRRAGGRMPDRPLGGRRPSQDRDVAAPGQLDPHGVVAAREQVVALERAPQAHRLDADDRVEARVEIVRALEDPPGDRNLAQLRRAASQRFLDDVTQEVTRPGRCVEIGAGEEPAERAARGDAVGSSHSRKTRYLQPSAPRFGRKLAERSVRCNRWRSKRGLGLRPATVSYVAATGPGPAARLAWPCSRTSVAAFQKP